MHAPLGCGVMVSIFASRKHGLKTLSIAFITNAHGVQQVQGFGGVIEFKSSACNAG
jgi:hypothetical protein